MQTSDLVAIADGLRVWTLPRTESGTVDLETPVEQPGERLVVVHLDRGRSEIVATTTITTRHPDTSELPPDLGTCQWVGTCTAPALWMQPHPLMSPVATCRSCLTRP